MAFFSIAIQDFNFLLTAQEKNPVSIQKSWSLDFCTHILLGNWLAFTFCWNFITKIFNRIAFIFSTLFLFTRCRETCFLLSLCTMGSSFKAKIMVIICIGRTKCVLSWLYLHFISCGCCALVFRTEQHLFHIHYDWWLLWEGICK